MLLAERSVGAAVLVVGLACHFDSQSEPAPWNNETEFGASEVSASEGDEGSETAAACDCNVAPGDCFEATGECEKGACVYPPKPAATKCIDDCEGRGRCDATGACICAEDDCASTCIAGPHATASCTLNGECVRACEAPWEDCDADPATGCEIPVGVPHQCSALGLDPVNGCWAAYCGAAPDPSTIDFGTFHCVDCPTCRQPGDSQCQWCNHETGNFYPLDACNCDPQALDLACPSN